MKRIFATILLYALLLSSCSGGQIPADTDTTEIDTSAETTIPAEGLQIQSIEDMTEIEGVLSVTRLEDFCTASESAYKVEFEIDGLTRYAEIALPNDYEKKNYPTVLYFPDIGYGVNYLVDNFAKKDVIAIRLFSRGSNENEGTKDFCGEDFADAEKLLAICDACDFLSVGGIFTAGAVTGSTFALKLASEYPDTVVGCAVVDAICDYVTFTEFRGESIKAMFLAAVGCSEDALPDELSKRSPANFYETISAPVLMFSYEESPFVPKEQSEQLKDLLDENGCQTEIHYLSPVSSDFNGTAFMKLIPWIKNITENLK